MPSLQKEKISLEEKMNEGKLSYDELQKSAERINVIIKLLDEKEMRWLELSERI
jgi:ATP-binding cassette subfamily F protein uup